MIHRATSVMEVIPISYTINAQLLLHKLRLLHPIIKDVGGGGATSIIEVAPLLYIIEAQLL